MSEYIVVLREEGICTWTDAYRNEAELKVDLEKFKKEGRNLGVIAKGISDEEAKRICDNKNPPRGLQVLIDSLLRSGIF